MSTVSNPPIPVTGLQGPQPPAHQPVAGGPQQPAPVPGPPLRTPQEVLAESRQRFPHMDERILRGTLGIPLNRAMSDMVHLIAERPPVQGAVPVLLQTGGAFTMALMPSAGVPGPDQALNIQRYVREGQDLYNRIMAGEVNVPHGKDEVAKVMWFLQALASSKASESSGVRPPVPALFKEGAFSVEDPDHLLEQFLFTANSYERSSSHLSEFQNQPGCRPRGVDIRGVPMPNERKTVLFARMPASGEAANAASPNMGDKSFLFIKMEPHGCRGFSAQGTGRAGEQAGFFKGVKRFFANIADTLGHIFGFARSVGQRQGLMGIDGQNNRERVPSDVKERYAGLTERVRSLQQSGTAEVRAMGERLAAILGRNAPLSSTGGIRMMLTNLDEARNLYRDLSRDLPETPDLALDQMFDDVLIMLRGHGDHPEYRIGNEIILMRDETHIAEATAVQRPDRPITRQGVMSGEDQQVLLAGLRYTLADIDNQDKVLQFELDSHRGTYHLGRAGQERPVSNNADLAKATVLALADGDERIARSLMTLANQSFAEPVTNILAREGLKSAQIYMMLGGPTAYHIARQPDTPQGAQVYRVGATLDSPIGNEHGELSTLNREIITVDRANSRVSGQMWMQVTFHPNGAIELVFDGEPSFAFTLTPAPAQGSNP